MRLFSMNERSNSEISLYKAVFPGAFRARDEIGAISKQVCKRRRFDARLIKQRIVLCYGGA